MAIRAAGNSSLNRGGWQSGWIGHGRDRLGGPRGRWVCGRAVPLADRPTGPGSAGLSAQRPHMIYAQHHGRTAQRPAARSTACSTRASKPGLDLDPHPRRNQPGLLPRRTGRKTAGHRGRQHALLGHPADVHHRRTIHNSQIRNQPTWQTGTTCHGGSKKLTRTFSNVSIKTPDRGRPSSIRAITAADLLATGRAVNRIGTANGTWACREKLRAAGQ